MVKKIFFSLLIIVFSLPFYAQKFSYELKWQGIKTEIVNNQKISFLYFNDANYLNPESTIPYFHQQFDIKYYHYNIQLNILKTEPLSNEEKSIIDVSNVSPHFKIESNIYFHRTKPVLDVSIVPIRKNLTNNNLEKLIAFEINLIPINPINIPKSVHNFKSNSVLSSGKWVKIKITQTGIYRLTYNQLQNMGFSNLQNIKIYGNGGKMLPFNNNTPIVDDLQQIPIFINKGNDQIFNEGDYILFFAQAPVYWSYNSSENAFLHTLHPYSDVSYYFITDNDIPQQSIETIDENTLSPNLTVTAFNDYVYNELELVNFIKSGRLWVGENFSNELVKTYTFSFPNMINGSDIYFQSQVFARSSVNSSFNFKINNVSVGTVWISAVSTSGSSSYTYASGEYIKKRITNNGGNTITVEISYNKPAQGGEGWLNYFDINVRRLLTYNFGQLSFRDVESIGAGNISLFNIQTQNPNAQVWDITNVLNPKIIKTNYTNNTLSFIARTDTLREFIVFDPAFAYSPIVVGNVPNQNLHGTDYADMIIITPQEFLSAAQELAQWHRDYDHLKVEVFTTEQVYNEFSSGMTDASAIKFFMKMFYDRANGDTTLMPRYLLLFGDGSYDNRHNFSQNTNFIPTYQSVSSLYASSSFTTDDYFVMLDDNEYEFIGLLDMGVGRLPVKSLSEAQNVIQKIKKYHDFSAFGNWRTYLTFLADDEDANEHMAQSNALATFVDTLYKQFNIEKIFLDAFPQESTPTGDRYPNVHDAITNRINKGCLLFNYTGHGNEYALTHEHVVINSDIVAWNNIPRLPFFITATCEFSRWDDYNRTSAGELVLLNKNGGGIGLLSTTRLVYSTSNFVLNKAVFDFLFARNANNEYYRLGDIYRLSKNKAGSPNDINKRNFSLLSDPALHLAYPKYNIITDSINGIHINIYSDTLNPLSSVTIVGHVEDESGNLLTTYEGILDVLVFDKPKTIVTLANDGGTPFSFSTQNVILYRGKATIKQGYFKIKFIIPKDISYTSGYGKISYYATPTTSQMFDATGYFDSLLLGGEIAAINDTIGPEINLYLNNEHFVNNGITNENPILIANLYDENGINTISNSIGHDICAYLDDNVSKKIILNDYYTSETDNYQRGTVKYQFLNLPEGQHKITFKAWDVANNSSTKSIYFEVKSLNKPEITRVYNYPNPFTTNTHFLFEHNQQGNTIDVQVQIFTITGKLIKTLQATYNSDYTINNSLTWNGKDDFDNEVAAGIYFYKLKIKTPIGSTEKYEKLVKLK